MEIYKALHAFQGEAHALQRDKINPHFGNSYLSLESLLGEILPLLNKHKLVLTQVVDNIEGAPALITTVTHSEDGSAVGGAAPLILDRDNSQGLGSAITYGRRYGVMSILGLTADEDDDAEKASSKPDRGGATKF